MPGKLLCLDIDTHALSALQLQSGLKGYRVLSWAQVFMGEGEGLDKGLERINQEMDLRSDICRVALSSDRFSYRNLRLPFRDRKKIAQVLPFEVESMIPFSLESVVVDFLVCERGEETEVLAISLERDHAKECLEVLKAYGIEPDVLEVRSLPLASWLLRREAAPGDGLLLDLGLATATLVFFAGGRIKGIRPFPLDRGARLEEKEEPIPEVPAEAQVASRVDSLCRHVQETLHSFRWNRGILQEPQKIFLAGKGVLPGTAEGIERFFGVPVEQVNLRRDKRVFLDKRVAEAWDPLGLDHALALALREEGKERGVNFIKGEFERKAHYSELRKVLGRVGLAAAFILCLLMADYGVDYYYLKRRLEVLDKRMTEVYRATFPDAIRIVEPLQQMKVRVKEVAAGETMNIGPDSGVKVIDILRDISLRIPASVDVKITTLVINPENVRISGETDTFNTVDSIKGHLEPSPLYKEVVISSANLDRTGKRVQFEVKMERNTNSSRVPR